MVYREEGSYKEIKGCYIVWGVKLEGGWYIVGLYRLGGCYIEMRMLYRVGECYNREEGVIYSMVVIYREGIVI